MVDPEQGVLGGAQAGDDQGAVGLRDPGDLVGECEEAVAVLDEDGVPRLGRGGDQLTEASVGREAGGLGRLVGGDGAQHLDVAQRSGGGVDVARRVGEPAGAAGRHHHLLQLEAVQQGLEELALSPEDPGQLLHVTPMMRIGGPDQPHRLGGGVREPIGVLRAS